MAGDTSAQPEHDRSVVPERGIPALLERFNQMWKEIDHAYHEAARRSGLSDCGFCVMYGLMCSAAPMPQKELSSDWQYSKQTVTSAVQQLERRGLIMIRLADGSRRDKVLELTEDGRSFVERNVRPIAVAEQTALEEIGEDNAELLIDLMRRYTSLLDQTIRQ
ncbi:MarR family winged helix-turn-helix transcriptional regulator [Bifidobacterium eulemuris]|uniref:MarR family transcriptional regulator n=1 Tax=Bifidobacterium eulemuris TaxID=1765219 RepID=A0A261G1F5_9BIFI|nr:MarR family transcriptional regulator [Bifidobacterium eulemuris]OZG65252.1 MarR family transcriptional regulator [Bifidobacterium eulemuris]QOL32330.1 MarR family transcriptional regulator [Bifidobacterium eulemuris]